MSSKEIVTVLKVNTENSGNNIKALKDEITQLKKSLELAEIGSEEFAKASKDLATAQANLKTILADGKKVVDATEGSYNHMVATMAELKKAWRATADEAKRTEIGKQIDSINSKLKEMDATIGNHQRNVGNYKGDIVEAFDEMGISTQSYGEALAEAQKSTEATRGTLDGVNKMASGIAGGFAAAQGVIALFGVESENLNKVMVKLMATMSIAQNIGKFKDLIEGYNQLKSAMNGANMVTETMTTATTSAAAGTNTLAKAVTTLKAALPYAAFAAFIAAVFTLIGNMDKLKNKFRDVSAEERERRAMADLNVELSRNFSQSASKSITRIMELKDKFASLGDDIDSKKKFVSEYSDELNNMGIKMSNVNDAETIFTSQTDEYINAVLARAKADALREQAAKNYASYLEARAKLEADLEDARAKKAAGTPDKTFLQSVGEVLIGSDFSQGANVAVSQKLNKDWTDEIAQKNIDEIQQKLEDAETEVEKTNKALLKEAAVNDAEANKVLGDGKPKGGGGGGSSSGNNKPTDTSTEDAKRIYERAKKALIDTKEEELLELKRIYEEELALLTNKGLDTAALTEEYGLKVEEINKKYAEKQKAIDDKLAADKLKSQQALLKSLNDGLKNVDAEAKNSEENIGVKYDTMKADNPEMSAVDSIQLEIDKEKELMAVREQAFNEKMAQIQAILDAELTTDTLTVEQEAELKQQYDQLQHDKVVAVAQSTNQIKSLLTDLKEEEKNTTKQLGQNLVSTFTSALNAASQILSAVQANIDTSNKEGFEKSKNLQIAMATINMLAGIVNAISSSMALPQPWGAIVAGINAATVATTGGIQIANIRKQTYDGANSGGVGNLNGGAGVSPNISMADMIPINYTKEVLTDTETVEMNKNNKIYVVESDISETQENVKVKESNSNF